MAIVNELVTKFSFQGNPDKLTNYNQALNKSIGLLAGFGAVAMAGAGAFTKFVMNTSAAIDPLIQLARTTNTSVESLQELGFIASQNGSDLAAVSRTAETFGAKIGESAQKGSEDFARLGVSVRDANGNVKSTESLLFEVGNRFKALGLSQAEQISFAEKLGIDKTLLQTLRLSGNEIDVLRNKARSLGVVTTKEADSLASMNDSLTILKYGFDSISNKIAIGFAPVLQDIAEKFTNFLMANKDLIANGLDRLGKILTATTQAIVRLSPVITAIGIAFLGAKLYAMGFAGVMGVIASPVALITAGIAALLFIVDDLIVAFQGGNSVIASFFDSLLGQEGATKAFLESIVNGFLKIWDIAKEIGNLLKYVFSGDIFVDFYNGIIDIGKAIEDMIFSKLKSVGNVFKSIGSFFGFGEDQQKTSSSMGNSYSSQLMRGYERNRAQTIGGNANITGGSVNQDVSINIVTDNPEAAGQSVRNGLNEQLSDAQYQFKRGGR